LDAIGVTAFSLIALVALLLLKAPLYIILLAVPLASSILYGGLGFAAEVVKMTASSGATWGLVFNVASVSWLVALYSSTLVVDRLGKELSKALKSDFLTLTIVPGVIGLLPVPGGALMSAPIVDSVGEASGLSKLRRNVVNIWYRHVFVYVYPLSTVVILTSSVFGLGVGRLVVDQLPLAAFMFAIGAPLAGLSARIHRAASDAKTLARDLSPIIIAVSLSFALSPLDARSPVERLSITVAVLAGAATFIALERVPREALKSSLRDRRIWELTVISFEVMLYRELFSAMDLSPLVAALAKSGVPSALVAAFLSAFFSFVSGTPTAGIAISAPMIQSIAGSTRAIADLAYAASFVGYLGSPLHLCYVYSSQYFRTGLVEGFKYLAPLTAAALAMAFAMYWLVWG